VRSVPPSTAAVWDHPGVSAPAEPVVCITGATGGLGRVAARVFAADGAQLGLVGTDAGRLATLARDVGLADDRWAPGVADLRDGAAAAAAIEAVAARLGPIDAVLHLVGGYVGGVALVDVDAAVVDDMLGQHVWSTFHVARAVVPAMTERGWGRFIAVTPVTTTAPSPRQGAYLAAKSAQETLLRVLAREVAGSGVTVNIIAVKAIDTEGVRDREPSPKTAGWTTPDEIVATMRWLCTDAASRVNGARIPLDGA
jgi:NAD(P)-dependent dehydrogenase (short-subunit alcohol dehydrogenase family)